MSYLIMQIAKIKIWNIKMKSNGFMNYEYGIIWENEIYLGFSRNA